MFKRFVGITLASFGLGLWLFSAGSGTTSLQADEPQAEQGINAPPQAIEAQPLATEAALKEQGVEPLEKGPVHEAFAQPTAKNPQAGPIIRKQPPKAIEELPPEQKPEGDNVQWIKGYWAWDAERNDFIWVCGFWRVPPPDPHTRADRLRPRLARAVSTPRRSARPPGHTALARQDAVSR